RRGLVAEMLQQRAANPVPLARGEYVSVADQINVPYRLDAHDPDQRAFRLVAPETDLGGDLALQFAKRHVRVVPAIVGDHAAISLGTSIDDGEDDRTLVISTRSDAAHRGNSSSDRCFEVCGAR